MAKQTDTKTPDSKTPDASAAPLTRAELAAMIRVNHAGEYGAVRIYQGQWELMRRTRKGARLARATRTMAAQEERHREWFAEELRAHGIAPSALLPLWHRLGFALGVGTALLGPHAAHACTEAVEEVIDEHYRRQLEALPPRRAPRVRAKIARAHKEELEHRDYARAEGAAEAPAYKLLHAVITTGCRLAIAASSRL